MAVLVDGQRIEQYRIVRWLGSGFSGECYEAEDTVLQRKVTFKLLHPWAKLPEAARRQFFREMQGISDLAHPSLAALFDYGETREYLYVARRYVGPGSLLGGEGRMWFRPPLPIQDAIQYAHQLAQVLHYIHTQGYFHGALTLANILVLRGQKLDDEQEFMPFLLSDVGTTSFVRRFGRPAPSFHPITAAPEQFEGRATPASDQYALAVLLFLWLAGRPPFLGSAQEIEQLKLTEIIPSLTLSNPSVTLQQEGILRRALSTYPNERYPSIIAFTEALLDSLAPPPTEPEQPALFSFYSEAFPRLPNTPHPDKAFPIDEATRLATPLLSAESAALWIDPETMPSLLEDSHEQPAADSAQTTQALASLAPLAASATSTEEATPPEVTPSEEATPTTTALCPYLLVTHQASGASQLIPIERDVLSIGRAGSSDILLDQDSNISRHHALLEREDTHYMLSDQRSTLGVYLNAQKLADDARYPLYDNDQIRIGEYTLTFQMRSAAALTGDVNVGTQ